MGYEIFEMLCKEHNITPGRVAREVNIDSSTISHWKSGKYIPKADKRRKIADYFNVTLDYLDNGIKEEPKDLHTGWIPVLGSVQAGIPIDAIEDVLDYEQIDKALLAGGDYFGLKVKGDSMAPRICSGDVVIVRKQSAVKSGDVAVVLVNGYEATIKKIALNEKGLTLIPYNPSFEPIAYSAEEVQTLPVQIIGKVVELRGKF